jgi:uncharacterized tellurite resistance protein B-like protein
MLEKIKSFFESHIDLTEQDGYTDDKLKVASAALLMEMLHTEETFGQEKQRLVMALLEKIFNLSEEQVKRGTSLKHDGNCRPKKSARDRLF